MKSFRTATNEFVLLTTKVSEVKDEVSVSKAGMVMSRKTAENSFCWDLHQNMTEKTPKLQKKKTHVAEIPFKTHTTIGLM